MTNVAGDGAFLAALAYGYYLSPNDWCWSLAVHRHEAQGGTETRFEQFRQVMGWVAGLEGGQRLQVAQQIAAIYQLTEFPEDREMYQPTLRYLLSCANQQSELDASDQHVVAAIEAVLKGRG